MDLKVHAMNGSGKTLAYLFPIVIDCINHHSGYRDSRPLAIVVTCSRFLAAQINEFLKKMLGGKFPFCDY